MALSYSGLKNYGKSTLPSVESWGTNMNIARDPPKAVFTRKIDKVGETSELTQMLEESTERACEAIQVYARGVNPSVSVSYSNVGNNGGQKSGGITVGGDRSAKLPYRVMRDGVFRPPVLRQENLLPLSRLPRAWTQAFTKPGFADFSKKMRCPQPAEKTHETRNSILKQNIRPTAVYKLEKPIEEPFEVRYMVKPTTLTVSASSGVRTLDYSQQEVKVPIGNIHENALHANARVNASDPTVFVNNNTVMDTDRYTHDVLTSDVQTNPYSSHTHTFIDDIADLSNIKTKETLHTDYMTNTSGYERNNYLHDELELDRKLPVYNASTNLNNPNIYKRQDYENEVYLDRNIPLSSYATNKISYGTGGGYDHGSRDYNLHPKIRPSDGYSVVGQVPKNERFNSSVDAYTDPHKSLMSSLVTEQMQNRFR